MLQSEAFNGTGWLSTIIAIWINFISWVTDVTFNQVLTVVISLLSAIFLLMKIYDQYLVTKKRKAEDK